MHSYITAVMLFLINSNVSMTELQNTVHERLSKIKTLINHVLSDCFGVDALGLIEELADDIEQLMLQMHKILELKATIHPGTAGKASAKHSRYCMFKNIQSS